MRFIIYLFPFSSVRGRVLFPHPNRNTYMFYEFYLLELGPDKKAHNSLGRSARDKFGSNRLGSARYNFFTSQAQLLVPNDNYLCFFLDLILIARMWMKKVWIASHNEYCLCIVKLKLSN